MKKQFGVEVAETPNAGMNVQLYERGAAETRHS